MDVPSLEEFQKTVLVRLEGISDRMDKLTNMWADHDNRLHKIQDGLPQIGNAIRTLRERDASKEK